jgi:putative sugar O-methyltransferase
MHSRVQEMFDELKKAPTEMLPSKYWEHLNQRNLTQLDEDGYANFKRTLARNYFTWIVTPLDSQIRFLVRNVPAFAVAKAATRSLLSTAQRPLSWLQSLSLSFLTRLVWEYVSEQEPQLNTLDEPLDGNPPRVYWRGKLISQDLANSALEYRSILSGGVDESEIRTIVELGPGYGRTAFVFLTRMPGIRYVLVDIPPALAVSERYLSDVFPHRRVFRFRPFAKFEDVRAEFEAADIAFLLPHQLNLLPDRCADLFINISSLHEMRIDQINYYFAVIRRIVRKYCYLKQWRESKIPFENVVVRESDYPIPAEWVQRYWRSCAVQRRFFEALFEIAPAKSTEG